MLRVTGSAMGIVAIVVGIFILAFPDLLRWLLGIGLIVVGLLAILRRGRYSYSNNEVDPFTSRQLQFFKRLIILKPVVISVGYHVSVKALPSSFANVG